MRYHDFANNGHYHVYSRGVDKREIFVDDIDRRRLLQSLAVLNNSCRPANIPLRFPHTPIEQYAALTTYCLMPNHFHLILQQQIDTGVSAMMQRWLNSYTKYFNARHDRRGRLFESVYQSVPIDDTEQLAHTTRYIHLNPISLVEPGWKEHGVRNPQSAIAYASIYPWSSYRHYIGQTRDNLVTDAAVVNDFAPGEYRKFVENYVQSMLTPGVST